MASKKTPRSPRPRGTTREIRVVGIGASAGGLEAFKDVLTHLPNNTGLAFVIVQHLDPKHASMASEIFSRSTSMPVSEVKDGVRVEADHVYVIPPNFNMAIMHGVLKLIPRAQAIAVTSSIDFFMKSLAEDQSDRAIGVVLSGTASDGTEGLRAIKAEGGITFAQDPKTAKYDGMPRSAITSGTVDLTLSPREISKELTRLASLPQIRISHEQKESAKVDNSLTKVFVLLRNLAHVDFSSYKQTTVKRRIARRMVVLKIAKIDDYAAYVQTHPEEAQALFTDILIHVTEFFRDQAAFKTLKSDIFPALMKDHQRGAPIRIWVPGCSTGEEAHSIIISLIEFLGDALSQTPIQVFATDISEQAIKKARAGVYSASIAHNVSPNRLRRFFTRDADGNYRIIKSIRDMCLFSQQDVTSDPPFSRVDLISCRNVLIYFESILQKRVIQTFHYALNPKGFLFLGRSEAVSGLSNLFALVDKQNKIYSKRITATQFPLSYPLRGYMTPAPLTKVPERAGGEVDAQKEADRIIQAEYAPSGVLVNNELEIIQFRGRTAPYLEPAPGQATHNLMKMARPEIMADLRMAIQEAKKRNAPVVKNNLELDEDGTSRFFDIRVIPVKPTPSSKETFFLVLFANSTRTAIRRSRKTKRAQIATAGEAQTAKKLQAEVSKLRDYQQALTEEYETTQEELTSSNEELQSTNEELQSTNEELETAKEELQSANEELTTVNEELQTRNTELNAVNNDLVNLLSSVEVPVVMVGIDHHIRRFTPRAVKVLNLISTDVGRPISDIKPNLNVPDLDELVSEAIDTVSVQEREVTDKHDHWYRLQIRPYLTPEKKVDGAVISLIDIQALKDRLEGKTLALEVSEAALNYALSVAETVPLPVIVLDAELRLRTANRSFKKHFQVLETKPGDSISSLFGIHTPIAKTLLKLLDELVTSGKEFTGFEMEHEFSHIGFRKVEFSGRKIKWVGEEGPESILLSVEDTTERRYLESTVKLLEAVAIAANEAETVDEALQVLLDKICAFSGWPVGHAYSVAKTPRAELVSRKVWHIGDSPALTKFRDATEEMRFSHGLGLPGNVLATGNPIWATDLSRNADFKRKKEAIMAGLHSMFAFPVFAGDSIAAVLEFFNTQETTRDKRLLELMAHIAPQLGTLIERKRGEEERAALLAREQKALADAEKGNRAKDLFLATLSHELRTPLTSILSWAQLLGRGTMDPDKVKRGCAVIEQSAKTQGQLINDLLDVSRIIMGKISLDRHDIDLRSVIRAAIESVQPMTETKSIAINARLGSKPAMIVGDPVRLQQIVWNLLTNAIKFSPENTEIEIQSSTIKKDGSTFAQIRVMDHGKGISPEFLPHVFDSFSQADSSSIRKHGGLGLGLAIVRSLVELHGGTVNAKSQGVGKGSIFTITLPTSTETRNAALRADKSEASSTAPLREINQPGMEIILTGIRVLLVDDDAPTCEALTQFLLSLGADVGSAPSASDAMKMLLKFTPDILVSDIAMPEVDGYSLIKKIRALPNAKERNIPAIALTAYAGGEDVKKALSAGFQTHLAKPVDANRLAQAIFELIEAKVKQ